MNAKILLLGVGAFLLLGKPAADASEPSSTAKPPAPSTDPDGLLAPDWGGPADNGLPVGTPVTTLGPPLQAVPTGFSTWDDLQGNILQGYADGLGTSGGA